MPVKTAPLSVSSWPDSVTVHCRRAGSGDDVVGFEHTSGVAVRPQPGMVVDDVEDLDVGAVGQRPVGDVGLPPFVGLLRGEAEVAALGPLVRLRGDEPAVGQDPPDRGDRRAAAVALLEMRRDRRRTGLVAGPVELLADGDDLVLDPRGVCCGLRNGRRDRGCRPASPSARYRCTKVITHRRDTPYSRATSLLDRPSTTTAVTTSCGIPIAHPFAQV